MKSDFYSKNQQLIRLINMNFVIRVYKHQEGKKIKTLVGGGQITRYMKEEDAIKQFQTCLNGQRSKYTWLDRNVLKIEFISK